jgi:GrpB-like predicted nucleotidyltransferase (UPF0157 family)
VPYDARWPREFERARAEVATAMGDRLAAIHHIGSTSIPGIHAKPIIDMLAVVVDLEAIDARSGQMRSLGYEVMGEFGIAGRRYFRRSDSAGVRTHHVHAFVEGSPHILRHLAFRDYLRAHPDPRDRYAALKQKLAAAHPRDIEAYMDGKDAFIRQIEAEALRWASPT